MIGPASRAPPAIGGIGGRALASKHMRRGLLFEPHCAVLPRSVTRRTQEADARLRGPRVGEAPARAGAAEHVG